MRIVRAATSGDIAQARALFLEYAASLDFELCFQSFDEELAGLPGDYAPPTGVLLLALEESREPRTENARAAESSVAVASQETVEGGRGTTGCACERAEGMPEAVGGVRGAVGCVALRPLDAETCEIKRLYVRPPFRGCGIGRALAEAAVAEARRIGYKRMRLDAIRNMTAAVSLYASMGFKEIAPYRHNPIPGAVYLELLLE